MHAKGFTLTEVLVAAVLASTVAGATMIAFVTAARMSRVQSNPAISEASGYVQQMLESFHNRVAADDAFFENAAATGEWIDDPNYPLPSSRESESILNQDAQRRYCVKKVDCDGDGTVGDCYAVTTRVCWNDPDCVGPWSIPCP